MEMGEFGKVGSHGRLKTVIQPRAYELQKLSCFASQGDSGDKSPEEEYFSSMGERVWRQESPWPRNLPAGSSALVQGLGHLGSRLLFARR